MASNQPFPSQSQQQNAASSASQGQRNIGYQASSHRQQASRNAAPNQQTNGTGASSWYDHLDNRTATTQHEGNDAYGVSSNGQRVYGNGVPIQDRRDGQNRATLYQSQQDDRVVNRYGSAVTTEPFAWQLPVSVQTVQSRPNPLTQQLPRQQPHQHPRQQPHHLSAPQPRPQPRPQQHRANRPQHNPHQHRHIPPNTAALPQQQPGSNQRVSGSLSQYITPRTAVPLSVALEYMPGLQFEVYMLP